MAFKAGHLAKVEYNSATVKGMGTWEMPGVSVDLLESTAFGDTAKQYMTGLLDYGNVNFAGLYDPADSTGQAALISANINNSKVVAVKLYVDSASYWTPNVTADSAAGLLMQSFSVAADKGGLLSVRFSGKATGAWVLV